MTAKNLDSTKSILLLGLKIFRHLRGSILNGMYFFYKHFIPTEWDSMPAASNIYSTTI